jgi:hypothetical protein
VSAEIDILHEIQVEMRANHASVERQLRALRCDLDGVIFAQQQIAVASGLDLVLPRRSSSVPTPIPDAVTSNDERW